jgi:hypothetical protein
MHLRWPQVAKALASCPMPVCACITPPLSHALQPMPTSATTTTATTTHSHHHLLPRPTPHTGKQVRKVLDQLWALCPTPEAAAAADTAALEALIQPLGLQRKRAAALQRFSREYVSKSWSCPTELHGIGKYGADAYYMFCRWEAGRLG